MRVEVDRETCVGSGNCVYFAPTVFDQDDRDGLVVVLVESPEPALRAATRTAALNCPVGAISVDRINSGSPPVRPAP
ncbi:Ferredoxin [Micromonospora purpureochromogenes]|uniref:Ferredoxin n=1 Tax=Micromonospora purpureochromogenes TaxID=47872 RepID=A0A1C4ZND0_9ACTN|nr:ferredoxin [Micromonospora purpureochromogenes]SCF34291.1 Ferredoxin [Micromonospora purpureochromogenes]